MAAGLLGNILLSQNVLVYGLTCDSCGTSQAKEGPTDLTTSYNTRHLSRTGWGTLKIITSNENPNNNVLDVCPECISRMHPGNQEKNNGTIGSTT